MLASNTRQEKNQKKVFPTILNYSFILCVRGTCSDVDGIYLRKPSQVEVHFFPSCFFVL